MNTYESLDFRGTPPYSVNQVAPFQEDYFSNFVTIGCFNSLEEAVKAASKINEGEIKEFETLGDWLNKGLAAMVYDNEGILLWDGVKNAMEQHQNEFTVTRETISIDKIVPGPVRTKKFPAEIEKRLRRIYDVVREVDRCSYEKFEEDFRGDADPLSEIFRWEAIAAAYAAFCSIRELDMIKKNAAIKHLIRVCTYLSEDEKPFEDDDELTAREKRLLLKFYDAHYDA
jgi:hypothetical protein